MAAVTAAQIDASALDLLYDEPPSHVSVVVRLKPPQAADEDISEIYSTQEGTITIRDPLSRGRSQRDYNFNHIFLPEHGQQCVCQVVAQPLIDRLLEGFNSCCFAYGQTGSGKTHSIFGEGNAEKRGLLARSMEILFKQIESRAAHKEVGMVVSFTEIYLDQVRDLGKFYTQAQEALKLDQTQLLPGAQITRLTGIKDVSDGFATVYLGQDLSIHESPQGLVYVEDLTLIPVTKIQEVLDVVNLGVQMRATHETRLNARSSRSHTIFSISIVQKSRSSEDIVGSVINFVDLAGSERLARSKSEGRRFQEAVVINSSLSALGKVVLALASDPKATRHVPYRDSKLTRILQNSLGGNSYTTLLTTIDPSAVNYEESLNSLSFADRCKNVQNRPTLGHIDQQESQERLVHRLQAEVATLKHRLEVLDNFNSLGGTTKKTKSEQAASSILETSSTTASQVTAPSALKRSSLVSEAPVSEVTALQTSAGEGISRIRASTDDSVVSRASLLFAEDEETKHLVEIQKQAGEKLENEKKQTEEANRRADAANLKLEQARQQQESRMECRRKEALDVKRRNKEIEVQIAKGKTILANVTSVLHAEQDSEMRTLQNHASAVLKSRESLARQIPPALATKASDDLLEAAVDYRNATKASQIQTQHLRQSRAVEGGHGQDVELLDKQHDQWLKEATAENQRIAAELEDCRERHQQWYKNMCAELFDTHGLTRQLTAILDALEGGSLVPSNISSDIRAPDLQLGAIRARLKVEGVVSDSIFEDLFKGLGDLRQRLFKYEKVIQKENAGDREISRVRALLPSGTYSLQTAGPTFAQTADCRFHWLPTQDAELFARDFCDIRDGDGASDTNSASETLQKLKTPELRALCLALRRRIRMIAAKLDAEKARLRDEVVTNLANHDRVDQIRQLEKDIADVKIRINIEEGQARQLEIAVQSCLRSTSRPTSRASTRASTRPNSAGPGRTAMAGGSGTRHFSAGPLRQH